MAQTDTQGSGRTHQRSDSPLLRQHEAGDVDLQHISTNLQTTDIFTKALGADKLWQFMTDLGLTIPDLPSLRGSTKETSQLRIAQAKARTPQLRITQAEAQIPQLRIILAEADSG